MPVAVFSFGPYEFRFVKAIRSEVLRRAGTETSCPDTTPEVKVSDAGATGLVALLVCFAGDEGKCCIVGNVASLPAVLENIPLADLSIDCNLALEALSGPSICFLGGGDPRGVVETFRLGGRTG